ncbi:DUF3516 domain-containing protein [Corallococcus sp. ZKHCc1 1396]|uniref:DUF3516 domain-containing protein n=1 Tax=Corallococcus soli TaxID=2710757 RepID=A0ABR9PUB6_9BACT|nr:DUF3516 domain-containing protein [Corallococcus soli]MBE4751513.1 DUF3516 domain-containing protein [Corallococcus soli]
MSAQADTRAPLVALLPKPGESSLDDRSTFERLQNGMPEPLESCFEVSHGLLLNPPVRQTLASSE